MKLKNELISHDIFNNLKSQKHINLFMEYHVFQVWDFMILLKSIQFWINSIYKEWYTNFSPWVNKIPWKFYRLITEIS